MLVNVKDGDFEITIEFPKGACSSSISLNHNDKGGVSSVDYQYFYSGENKIPDLYKREGHMGLIYVDPAKNYLRYLGYGKISKEELENQKHFEIFQSNEPCNFNK